MTVPASPVTDTFPTSFTWSGGSTTVHFDLVGAPEVQSDRGEVFTPTHGHWAVSTFFKSVKLHLGCGSNRDLWASFSADEAPGWVPRPIEGWDAGLDAMMRTVAR